MVLEGALYSQTEYSPLLLILLYSFILCLFFVIPGRVVVGYVENPQTKSKYRYRLNGLLVFWIVLVTSVILVLSDVVPANFMFIHRKAFLHTANIIGLIASIFFYWRGDTMAKYKPQSSNTTHSNLPQPIRFAVDFYCGLEDNPHYRDVLDAKMFLYLIGGTVLVLNVLSCAAHQYLEIGYLPTSTALFCMFFTYFVEEYLWHEEIHLYTYDFVAEKLGAKLIWGCTVFYPFVYPIGAWTIAENPSFTNSTIVTAVGSIMFIVGYCLARGANNQKYLFKKNPKAKFLGIIEPISIGGKVLASGFWGLSRHINYMGEIMMATGLALLVDHTNWLAWIHPVVFVGLFVGRQMHDDKICAQKYGELWTEYCRRVPYRIIPYVY